MTTFVRSIESLISFYNVMEFKALFGGRDVTYHRAASAWASRSKHPVRLALIPPEAAFWPGVAGLYRVTGTRAGRRHLVQSNYLKNNHFNVHRALGEVFNPSMCGFVRHA